MSMITEDLRNGGALYYPFSRCINSAAMKQMLLVFDSITFIDPRDDDSWRAHLMKDMENADPHFAEYRTIDACMPWLRRDGVVQVLRPDQLRSFDAQLTTTAILSDLGEAGWVGAADPAQHDYPLSHSRPSFGPVWETFPEKVPLKFLEALRSSPRLSHHLVRFGGTHIFTYAAGSAVGINTHLAAADELGLAPVTSSAMHHRLMLMKLSRATGRLTNRTRSGAKADATGRQGDQVASSAAIRLISEILPPRALEALSLEQILEFRQRTAVLRRAFVDDVQRETSSRLAGAEGQRAAQEAEQDVVRSVRHLAKAYGDEIAAHRDHLWPRLVAALASKTGYAGMTALGGAAVALSYIRSPGYVLTASVALGVSLLKPAEVLLEWRAERNDARRKGNASVAYLSQVRSSLT